VIVTLLVYLLAGQHYYVPVKDLNECLSAGNQLILSGTIQHFQCAKVHEVKPWALHSDDSADMAVCTSVTSCAASFSRLNMNTDGSAYCSR